MAKKKPADVPGKSASPDAPDFEGALSDLEGIVGELEEGSLTLSDSIERYEKGVKLLKQCHQELDQVQRKIELLTRVNDEGEAETTTFDSEGRPEGESMRKKTDGSPADVDDEGRLF